MRRVRDRASRLAVLTDACIVVQAHVDKLGHRLLIRKALRVLTGGATIGCSSMSAQSTSGALGTDCQMLAAAQSCDHVTPAKCPYVTPAKRPRAEETAADDGRSLNAGRSSESSDVNWKKRTRAHAIFLPASETM